MAGFSPLELVSHLETMGGISRRWKYSVEITPPPKLKSSVPNGKIDMLALTVLMPGRTMATTEQRMYGINKTVPYETGYDPILMTMLNPNDWSTRIFWNDWLDYIQNPSNRDMRYYKSMIGQIEIAHYHDEETELNPNSATYAVVLEQAWPERMSAYAMGYDNSDWGNFEISIRYKRWHQKGHDPGQRHGQSYGGRGTTTTTQDTRARFNPDLRR